MRKLISIFELNFGITQAFGFIDAQQKHAIRNTQDYFFYKQYFFLNVQAVCDSKVYFIDVECK